MSPPGCQKMSATPCHRNAEERFPVLSLKSREQEPPNPLLIRDKAFYSLVHHHAMGERENQFSDDPVPPDGVRDGRHLEIRRQLPHHTPVEITYPLTSLAASQRGDKEEVGVLGHRRERRLEVEVMELCPAVRVAGLHHRLLRRREVTLVHEVLL